ncbi:protease Do [Pirellula staleyi DSM 6068]|uniref:Protease Do n=1 Tax=Pirellula staleyi (strain ATCC 27377 / DSM 6068 / ICPB 4128) TaxID=530564 RepID=D2QXG2_PIRSD|nr:trypsin-like peptidase domain-containing protein [Pirellula staleyi]ADB16147.1 protease Do [Pirellula staleyi DSM 6068]
MSYPELRSPKYRFHFPTISVVAGSMMLVALGGYWLGDRQSQLTADSRPAPLPAEHERAVGQASSLSQAFRGASERVLPAVVAIQQVSQNKLVRGEGRSLDKRQLEQMDPLLKRFFENLPEGADIFENPGAQPRQESSGSGVIIDAAGVILTNNHVVAGGGKITVKLHDGREFVATDVKTDPSTDLAIVRIKSDKELPYAELGDSDEMRIGDWVLALGQPFGLNDTVTAGIISAKGRAIGMMRHEEFLQTDAAINPGNSGGPLVNLRGQVIGINTAISSSSGGFQGIGFAVPVNVAKWVSSQLLSDGKVHRAYLGVGIQPIDQQLAGQLGIDTPSGALVTDVQPNSPAASAGLLPQDVIVEINGQPVANHRQLQAMVGRLPLNQPQKLTVVREGKRVELSVTVREQPENYGLIAKGARAPDELPPTTALGQVGVEVTTLSEPLAEQLGLAGTEGVVITAVAPSSIADSAGLAPGDVVLDVKGIAVRSPAEFQKQIDAADLAKGVLLRVKSQNGTRFVVLRSE